MSPLPVRWPAAPARRVAHGIVQLVAASAFLDLAWRLTLAGWRVDAEFFAVLLVVLAVLYAIEFRRQAREERQ